MEMWPVSDLSVQAEQIFSWSIFLNLNDEPEK